MATTTKETMKRKFKVTVLPRNADVSRYTVYIDRKDGETFNVQDFQTHQQAQDWARELAKFLGFGLDV